MKTTHAPNLKWLLEAVPEGFLVDADWMSDNGFGRGLLRDFLGRGWLERLDRDVYIRPSEGSRSGVVGWKTCLLSLSHVMGRNVHIGGTTALAMFAFADQKYLDPKVGMLTYCDEFPSWLESLQLDIPFVTRANNLFHDPVLGVRNLLMKQWLPWGWTVRMSTPERAILEALDEFPDNLKFLHLDAMFRRLAVLSSELMVELLRDCRKNEVKRLFFVFSDRHDHAWRYAIDRADFDLGTDDLGCLQDGKLHPRQGISVPSPFPQPGETQ